LTYRKQQGKTKLTRLKQRWWRYLIWLGPVALLMGISLSQFLRAGLQGSPVAALDQDALVQAYFNQAQADSYRELDRPLIRPGQDLEQLMIRAIRQSKVSIDVAVQEFRLPRLAQALAERQRAGVRVRVVLENTYTQPWAKFTPTDVANLDVQMRQRYQEWRQLVDINSDNQLSGDELRQRDVFEIFNQNKIPWLDDTADGSLGSALMHHKFMVIDGQTVVAGSANWTPSDVHGDLGRLDTRGNANSLLVITSRELAAKFEQEFTLLWGDGPDGQPNSRFGVNKPLRPPLILTLGASRITVKFSPASQTVPWQQTTNGLIGKTLLRAKRSVNLALFVFSDQEIANTLAQVHERGRNIRVLVDPGFIYRDFSEALDLMGLQMANTPQARKGKCFYETGNRPWTNPIASVGTPNLAIGDKLHHKFAVIDNGIVIIGSHNWSESANWGNDEFVLVIENPTVATHYIQEFERLYANSQLGRPSWLMNKIAAQKRTCGGTIQARPALSSPPAPPAASLSSSSTPLPNLPLPSTLVSNSPSPVTIGAPPPVRINLNTASQAELESLPGIGTKVAQAIIRARSNQPFRSLSDLDGVPGVGPNLLRQLESRVTW
jgi:competence ComEA-like helix-hairpin-helix protein